MKIRFDYTNNESRTVNIDGKDVGVKVPFLAASMLMLPGDKFKNVKVSGGKVMADQDQSIVIGTALEYTHGRRVDAATRLGIGRNTITRKIAELKLESED